VTQRASRILTSLLVLGGLAIALVFSEVAVRMLFPQPVGLSHQDEYGLAMHYPGITRYLSQYGHSVTMNNAGMRDREHLTAKPAGVFRVLLLGDSFTEALQVPFEASLPALLELELGQQTGRRVEVVNAGVSGWGTDDELRYLTTYGLAYQPDLVVVAMTLHNDISDNLRRDWHTMRDGALVEQPHPRMSYWDFKLVTLKAYLASRFELYQLARRVRHRGEIRQIRNQLNAHIVQLCRAPTPENIRWGVQFTGLLLVRLKSVTDAAGARMAVVLLPLRVQLSDSSYAEFVRSAGATPQQMPAGTPQRLMEGIAGPLGIPVIDLLPAFQQWTADSLAPLYLEWDGHWNEAGHRLAARVVTRGLLEAGVIR
jgi:hypothetical protein